MPPSEGKSSGGRGAPWQPGTLTSPELDERRADIARALIKAMGGSGPARQKLLGVKGDALAEATAVNTRVLAGPTRPAIERYTGVLYGALDYAGCPSPLRRKLDRQVRIFSGLWGMVAPRDPIPDYKLKMGAVLGR
ncbi:MAG: peroxide stress protein YaaA, partial [Acidimicrobiales bacterium]